MPAGRRTVATLSPQHGQVDIVLDIATKGVIDLGEIGQVPHRVDDDDTIGALGITWVPYPADTLTMDRVLRVQAVDPAGPAAAALRPGDVVTHIDGIDVRGYEHSLSTTLMRVPPGTRLRFRLQRGATVDVVAASPP